MIIHVYKPHSKTTSSDLLHYSERLFHKNLDPGCSDLLSSSHTSFSGHPLVLGDKTWFTEPLVHPKGAEWDWGQGSVQTHNVLPQQPYYRFVHNRQSKLLPQAWKHNAVC